MKFSRRQLLVLSAAAMTPFAGCKSSGPAKSPSVTDSDAPRPNGPGTLQAWMDTWMDAARAPEGALHLYRFREPMYVLTKTIRWRPNPGQERFAPVEAPVGFVTDLASIPQVFFSLLRPDGEYTYPAIIHDFMYWTQTRSREEADEILRLGMADFDIGAVTMSAIYDAVRIGGGAAWSQNAKLKAAGEKRVLKLLPDDPRVRWADWKLRPGVFVEDR